MAQKRRQNSKKQIVHDSSDSDSCPNSPMSPHSEDDLHVEMTMQDWTTEWYANHGNAAKENWTLGSPKFKFCKKRKEYFTDRFETIWYKSPYKYNALLNFTHNTTFERSPFVQASLSIIFEDGTPIDINTDDGLPSISRTESIFRAKPTGVVGGREVKLGPFQFNVCSYKYDSKRFRLQLHFSLVESDSGIDMREAEAQDPNARFTHMCTMTSPAFLIKAKKPIAKPGIKSKKRPREDKETSLSPVNNSGMEINHIPIPASFSNTGHIDIASLISLPMASQTRYLESQLMSFNNIINNMAHSVGQPPLEPPKKRVKQEVSFYGAPMQSYAEPIFYGAQHQMIPAYYQQNMLVEEPFRSLEMLKEEDNYSDLFGQTEPQQQQGFAFDSFDSFTVGPQLVDMGNDFFL